MSPPDTPGATRRPSAAIRRRPRCVRGTSVTSGPSAEAEGCADVEDLLTMLQFKPLARLACGIVIATAALTRGAYGQLSVSPLVLPPNGGDVTVTNGHPFPIRVGLTLADFEQDGDGGNHVSPLGTTTSSCSGRVTAEPLFTQLSAREQRVVRVAIRPDSVPCWTMLIVEGSRTSAPGGSIGVKAYDAGSKSVAGAEVAALDATPAGNLAIVLRNYGTRPLRVNGLVEIRGASGAVVATVPVPEFGAHPGVSRRLELAVPSGLPRGRYVVLAVLDAGLAELVAGQRLMDLGSTSPEE